MPDTQVQTVASAARLMLHEVKVPDTVTTMLKAHLTTSQALVDAMRAVWQSCPPQHQPQVRVNLDKIIQALENEHGSVKMEAIRQRALVDLHHKLIEVPEKTDTFWAIQASALAGQSLLPPSSVIQFLSVTDLRSFIAALSAAVQQTVSSIQLEKFIKAVIDGLQPEEPSAYSWFETGTQSNLFATPEKAPPAFKDSPDLFYKPGSEWASLRGAAQQECRVSGLLPPTSSDTGNVVRVRGLGKA